MVAQEAIDSAADRGNPINICISLIYTIPIYTGSASMRGPRSWWSA